MSFTIIIMIDTFVVLNAITQQKVVERKLRKEERE